MSRAEREAFLADVHVGIVSIAEDGRGPLSVPVWYRYEPGGDVFFATGGESHKARLLARSGRASLCVQTETSPYRYVSVEGPTNVESLDFDRDIRAIAVRYLGDRVAELYLATAYPQGTTSEILVRLRPRRWLSADFSRFGAAG